MNVDENVVKCEISFFTEHDEVLSLIQGFCSKDWEKLWREKWGWLQQTLVKYLEQPTLLNPYLEEIVTPLTSCILEIMANLNLSGDSQSFKRIENDHLSAVCKILQLYCRVRGYKHICKLFPHEVHQLEPCLLLLRSQDKAHFESWETRYIILLWLSVLCLIPFDICSIDSSLKNTGNNDTAIINIPTTGSSKLVSTIVFICQDYLSETGSSREAAATCLAALLTRPDMEAGVLSEFINWSCGILEEWSRRPDTNNELSTEYFRLIGTLLALAQIFKKGHRNNLLVHAPEVLGPCLKLCAQDNQMITRKLTVKLVQRVGMTFLQPRVAKWRYQRGSRSLLVNLESHKPLAPSPAAAPGPGTLPSLEASSEGVAGEGAEEEGEEGVQDELEDIVGRLLMSLRDKDTVVRWSSAKGIGRIAMRLPQAYVTDIVTAILETFEDAEADAAWHGGCLALAELCRRGLLLPLRLADVVPIVAKAIHFDVLRGQHSVGIHVRDAACYVCWAFARAYSPAIMRPYVKQLSDSMLLTALFDREVNCRRAASAAFQENVGRQGNENFPFGIELISLADFFSLNSRSAAYLRVAQSVASLDDSFHESLETHLRDNKLSHWDEDVRVLAAKALGKLATLSPSRLVSCLQSLSRDVLSNQASRRHGVVLGIAEVLLSLRIDAAARSVDSDVDIPPELVEEITQVVQKIDKARLYRGKGGEILRQASCYLIESISRAHFKIGLKTKTALVDALNENLKQPHEKVQKAAISGLRQSLFVFYAINRVAPSERLLKQTVFQYVDWLQKAENVAYTRSAAAALGVLPLPLLCFGAGGSDRLQTVLHQLDRMSRMESLVAGDPDAETRRNCVVALAEIGIRLLTLASNRLPDSLRPGGDTVVQAADDGTPATEAARRESPWDCVKTIFNLLKRGCEDYSVDKRGDIGSWIRTAALRGLVQLTLACLRIPRREYFDEQGALLLDSLPKSKFSRYGISLNAEEAKTGLGLKGWHVETACGVGVVVDVKANGGVLLVSFPAENASVSALVSTTMELAEESTVDANDLVLVFRSDAVRPLEPPLSMYLEQLKHVDHPEPSQPVTTSYLLSWNEIFDDALCKVVICLFLKQLCEKLDWVRGEAGQGLSRLVLCNDPKIQDLVSRVDLEILVGSDAAGSSVILWNNPPSVFPRLTKFLHCCKFGGFSEDRSGNYFYSILSGLVVSVGGLSESVVREASGALLQWCQAQVESTNLDNLRGLANCLLDLIKVNKSVDRIVVPALRTVHLLLRNDFFRFLFASAPDSDESNSFGDELLACVRGQTRSSDISKLYLCADLFVLICGSGGSSRLPSFHALVNLLGHKYPKVRKYAAEQLYMLLLSDPAVILPTAKETPGNLVVELGGLIESQDTLDAASTIVIGTVWDTDISLSEKSLNELRELLRVPAPKLKQKTSQTSRLQSSSSQAKQVPPVSDELESYESLVRDAGY